VWQNQEERDRWGKVKIRCTQTILVKETEKRRQFWRTRYRWEQTSVQTMNAVFAGPSNAGAYTYIRLYKYIMLYYTYKLLCMHIIQHKHQIRICQDHKINTLLHIVLYNIAHNNSHINTFVKMNAPQPWLFNSAKCEPSRMSLSKQNCLDCVWLLDPWRWANKLSRNVGN